MTIDKRKRRRLVTVGVLVALLVGGAVTATVAFRGGDADAAGPEQVSTKTAEITRSTLVRSKNVDGKLGYAGSYQIAGGRDGTITALPKVGDVINKGKPVYHVNGKPVPLFVGDTPFWRELVAGMSDGPDVKVLEQNLKDLGFFGGVPDEKFTSYTTTAIRNWQKSLGLEQTGRLAPGDVVVQPSELRVSKVDAALGGPAQGNVLTASGTDRVVTVDLSVADQTLAQAGAKVEVSLPGGGRSTGTVQKVGTVASSGQNGTGQGQGQGNGQDKATIPVEVSLDDPAAAGNLDGAPVSVGFTSERKENVLSVPVNALLALAEGGYAVEVVEPDGSKRLVKVELGMFAQGKVEVSGDDVREGMKVTVAGA
ncbi:peptidoglycan-binding protein [Longimycelium tulufanense]|uniref:Peptidoglycan-binding protein n=1 Tax=Longimycelium tulufanense TaxID=907463 RepID=A0A8J3FS99_9PSEU|nr:peptidoglycan-binding protein [Longimycelium tulufanense]GGM33049.1 peptidoglycan-binding protein [Longimycelium tulufanense]